MAVYNTVAIWPVLRTIHFRNHREHDRGDEGATAVGGRRGA